MSSNITFRDMLYLVLLTVIISCGSFAQMLMTDIASKSAEEIANKTYVEEQSDLQHFLFKSYNRKLRPLRNQSLAIQIGMHIYIMHYAVNQIEQTITVNGHIYMTWDDEIAVWDPAAFNNVRSTIAKQWDLWQPDLRVANSVSGVNQYFEISKRSHITLTSITPTRTKVEVYPTFAIKIGCHFDYSDYPSDIQRCAMRLYTTQLMNEVELHIYYGLNPSVMLGWGEQAAKRHINDWELLSVSSNLSYYTNYYKDNNIQFINERPSTAQETQHTWSLVLVWIELRRNASLFLTELALPLVVATLLNIGSFAVVRAEHAVLVVLINLFAQSVCLGDAVFNALPPVVGNLPRIARYANALLVMTCVALALHVFALKFNSTHQRYHVPSQYLRYVRPILKLVTPKTAEQGIQSLDKLSSTENVDGITFTPEAIEAAPPISTEDDTHNGYSTFRIEKLDDDAKVECDTLPVIALRNFCALFYTFFIVIIAFIIFLF